MVFSARYAAIFSTTAAAPKRELQIDGKRIKLFREVLLSQMVLRESETGGWWLEFFTGTDYAQRFEVHFERWNGVGAPPKRDWEALAALAYVHCPGVEDGSVADPVLASACEQTSQYVRGSRAVKPEQLYEASTHWGYVDGRGAQYLSKIASEAQFERHVLLHALAYAYLSAMEQLSDALSTMLPGSAGCEEALRQHYKAVALFNAKSFFYQPVKLEHGPTCWAWRRIDSALDMRVTNEELSRQVQSAHDIYSLDAEKQADRRAQVVEEAERHKALLDRAHQQKIERGDRLRNTWLGIVTVVVAVASMPGIMEVLRQVPTLLATAVSAVAK